MPMYNYFPQTYQPQMYPQQMQMQGGYNQQQVPMQNQQMNQTQAQVQAQTSQIQQSGFIPVPSEEVARNYPVAPGNSVSFKNENAPYVYVKTMGYSPLDRPIFEKFRLVKEESAPEALQEAQIPVQEQKPIDLSAYALKSEFDALSAQFEDFKAKVDAKVDAIKKSGCKCKSERKIEEAEDDE